MMQAATPEECAQLDSERVQTTSPTALKGLLKVLADRVRDQLVADEIRFGIYKEGDN